MYRKQYSIKFGSGCPRKPIKSADRKHTCHRSCSLQGIVVTWLTKVLWKGLLSTFNCQGRKENVSWKFYPTNKPTKSIIYRQANRVTSKTFYQTVIIQHYNLNSTQTVVLTSIIYPPTPDPLDSQIVKMHRASPLLINPTGDLWCNSEIVKLIHKLHWRYSLTQFLDLHQHLSNQVNL